MIPPNATDPIINGANVNLFVGTIHAKNVVTIRSHSGFIIFIVYAPIIWHSKMSILFRL